MGHPTAFRGTPGLAILNSTRRLDFEVNARPTKKLERPDQIYVSDPLRIPAAHDLISPEFIAIGVELHRTLAVRSAKSPLQSVAETSRSKVRLASCIEGELIVD